MPTTELRRAYARGYNAGRRNAWPAWQPPTPPDPVAAALVRSLANLCDAVDAFCAASDPEDAIAIEFWPLADAGREALSALTGSLTAPPPMPAKEP